MKFLKSKWIECHIMEIPELTGMEIKKELEDYYLDVTVNECKEDILEFSFDEDGKIKNK